MNDLIKIYVNTEIMVTLVQQELDNKGVRSVIKNNFQSGVIAGFGGGLPSGIELFIYKEDKEKALQIIKDFEV